MGEDRDESFDSDRAELFESLGHPNRIRILQALQEEPLAFAVLKKRVRIVSSGHLTFHLDKLGHLLLLQADGRYSLTDDGREALRMVNAAKETGGSSPRPKTVEVRKAILVGIAILVLALASVVAVQQLQIAQSSVHPYGASVLSGKSFWSVSLPLGPWDRNVSLDFHGVRFTLIPAQRLVIGLVEAGIANVSVTDSTVNFTGFRSGVISWHMSGIVANGTTGTVFFVLAPNANVKVVFPDGSQEVMRLTWPAYDNATMTFYDAHQTFPWFSHHTGPQAAVVEEKGVITLYVSTGG